VKNFEALRYNFLKIFKFLDLKRYDYRKFYKYIGIRRFDLKRAAQNFNPKSYLSYIKKANFISYNFLFLHLPIAIIFFGLLYLVIPTFYNYNKSDIESIICKKQNIKCTIKGKVNYRFYPTPRIIINNVIINDFFKKKDDFAKIERAVVKLSFKNLLAKEKHKFKKIELNNFEINFNLKNLKGYKNIFSKKINFIPLTFKKGQIIFFDGKDYVATISEAKLNLVLKENLNEGLLKGRFLNDDIYISLENKTIDGKPSSDLILKMSDLNLLVKANFFSTQEDADIVKGNILIKKKQK